MFRYALLAIQAMKIAIVGAGFTGAEADELRRSMATFKAKGMVSRFGAFLDSTTDRLSDALFFAPIAWLYGVSPDIPARDESWVAATALVALVASFLKEKNIPVIIGSVLTTPSREDAFHAATYQAAGELARELVVGHRLDAGHEGGHDVGGVAIQGLAGPVVAHGGAWVRVTRSDLNVA